MFCWNETTFCWNAWIVFFDLLRSLWSCLSVSILSSTIVLSCLVFDHPTSHDLQCPVLSCPDLSFPTMHCFSLQFLAIPFHSTRQTDWVADMIDEEIYRQYHHKEYEEAWMKKNKAAILSRLSDASSNGDSSSSSSSSSGYPSSMMMLEGEDREAFAEHKRDERMAFLKPEKYCADRCLATGNCDIFEDFYELGPEDVLRFCEECVLFDENGNDNDIDSNETMEKSSSSCEVPDAFYEKEPPLRP